MMNKKARRSNMKAPLRHNSSYAIGDNKARLKYESLLQDYHDLLKESEAKKKKLQKINQKKLRLLNEVWFLRKRYKKLTKNPPQQNQIVVLKKQYLCINQSSEDLYGIKSSEAPSTSRVAELDLNQTSLLNEEESENRVTQRENVKGENHKNWYGADEKERGFVCRDLGTGSSRAGKRKISWEDQVALRV